MPKLLPGTLAALFVLLLSVQALAAEPAADVATIQGRVISDRDGSPLAGVEIILIDPATPNVETVAATTDTSGHYTVTQPLSNTWKIKFNPVPVNPFFSQLHIPEYYNDVYTLAEAMPITAAVGALTSNINASLATGGQITGRVTDAASGKPVSGVRVTSWEAGAATDTDSSGYYTLTTHMTQTQRLYFDPPDRSGYALEFYNNQTRLSEAKPVTVPEGRDLRGVDVTLTPGGLIKGTVTSSWLGLTIENPGVEIYNADGELVTNGSRYTEEPLGSYEPDPPGHFTAYNLPPGSYRVKFLADRHAPVFTNELVQVKAGETVSGIRAQLRMSVTVSAIATSPAIPDTILFGLAHSPMPIFTADGGKQWHLIALNHWVRDPALYQYPNPYPYHFMGLGVAPRGLPGEGTRIMVTIGDGTGDDNIHGGFYRSGDFGQNWGGSDVDPRIPDTCGWMAQNQIIPSPLNPTKFYLLFTCFTNSFSARLLTSDNAGVTWQDVTELEGRTLELDPSSLVYPSPVVEDRVYVYTSQRGWRMSSDGGLHWEDRTFPVESLALDARNADYLYGWSPRTGAPTTRVGKRSTDGGSTWQDWTQQPCPYSFENVPPTLIAHPAQSQVLFLRCDNELTEGLYRSDNGGDSWQKLEDEIGQLLVADLGRPERLLWAKDDGLWASTDNGESWQVLLQDYRIFATPLYLPSVANR